MAQTHQAGTEVTGPAWDGDQGQFWVDQQPRHETMLGGFTDRLLAAARIGPGDNVLDIGCGCGDTTRAAARTTEAAQILGIDLSATMLTWARAQAAPDGLGQVTYVTGDAQEYPFTRGSFDVALSRFGVMFFNEPHAAFTNIAAALRPGGRLNFTCWQPRESNQHVALPLAVVAAHLPGALPTDGTDGAFSLSDPQHVWELLSAAGFSEIQIEPVEQRLWMGHDADDVLTYYRDQPMAQRLIATAGPRLAERLFGEIRTALLPHQTPEGVFLKSAAWLVTAIADPTHSGLR